MGTPINGVVVTGCLVPTDSTDTYAVTDNTYAIDGHRSVPDQATMLAIPAERRRQGMLVAVHDDGMGICNCIWQLNPPPWNYDITDWNQLTTEGVEEAPEDGQIYGRSDANWVPVSGSGGIPGGTNGQLQYNANGAFGGLTMSGDATMDTVGNITVNYTNGVPFGTMAVQNADAVDITGGTITGLPDPTADSDAATKAYVDANAQGLTIKSPVDVASTGINISLSGGATLTVDGVALSNGSRILLKDQTNSAQNGIYTVGGIGTAYTLTRASDANTAANLPTGSYVLVNSGTQNGGSSYVLTTAPPITIDTTPLTWVMFSSASSITGGFGIDVTGNQVSIDPTYPGQGSITTVGTVVNGTIDGGTW